MEQKIIKIGNSFGIIIPKKLLHKLRIKQGSKVFVEKDSNSDAIVIQKQGSKSPVAPDFARALDKVTKQYHKAFEELAQK